MPDFTFRIRFQISPNERLMTDATEWFFTIPGSPRQVRIVSRDGQTPIQDATEFVAVSRGWASSEEASRAGEHFEVALATALTHMGIGVDFGRRMPKAWATTSWLAELSQGAGCPVLNDSPGLMVYGTDPTPSFIAVSGTGHAGKGLAYVEQALAVAVAHPLSFTDRERIAFDLLNASFFERSNETRFLTLVMAVEVLLESQSKSETARQHVEKLMTLTRETKECSVETFLTGSGQEHEVVGQHAE
jgi:hypothetical protein